MLTKLDHYIQLPSIKLSLLGFDFLKSCSWGGLFNSVYKKEAADEINCLISGMIYKLRNDREVNMQESKIWCKSHWMLCPLWRGSNSHYINPLCKVSAGTKLNRSTLTSLSGSPPPPKKNPLSLCEGESIGWVLHQVLVVQTVDNTIHLVNY